MAYTVPLFNRISRFLMRPFFRSIMRMLGPVRLHGLENIPRSCGYVIAIYHISLYEAPLMAAFWPVPPEIAGASDVWHKPGQSLLARLYGGIPVHRGEYDRKLLDTVQQVIEAGRPLLIAPEGGRSHTPGMRPAQPGIGFIIEKTGAPVVPVGIVGTTSDYFARGLRGQRPALDMHIGAPLLLPPNNEKGKLRRLKRQQNVDSVMYQIAALLPPEYRGVYAS
jgi:1-acyl-sn-glycerol-3-phosphate acyltransferase